MNHEQLIFIVEKNLDKELRKTVKDVAGEAKVVFRADALYTDSTFDGYSGDYFVNAGEIVKKNGPYGTQRNAGLMIGKIHQQLTKIGRHVILITTTDITCRRRGEGYLNFCFGFANSGHVVISMARFGHLPINEQKLILAGLIMHELGHIYDLAAKPSRVFTEDNIGMHCTNKECVMQQGGTVDAFRTNFNFLKSKEHESTREGAIRKYYCQWCAADIEDYFLPPLPPRKTSAPPLPPRRTEQ